MSVNIDQLRDLAEKMPFPVIEWHHVLASHQLTVRVNKQIAYDGPWTRELQDWLDGCTNATLLYAALKGAFDGPGDPELTYKRMAADPDIRRAIDVMAAPIEDWPCCPRCGKAISEPNGQCPISYLHAPVQDPT